jgi:hypothetical protein
LLAVARFGAGDRDYWLCTSMDDLQRFCASTAPGYPSASVAVFPASLLKLRGVVDDVFIDKVQTTFVEFDELLVLRLTPQKTGLLTGNACGCTAELLAELRDEFGCPVAVGECPEWDPLSTQPPEKTGHLHTSIRR